MIKKLVSQVKWACPLLWVGSMVLGLAPLFGVYPMWKYDMVTATNSVLYSMFHRVGWSLALSWVVLACANGYGSVVNSFLSWGSFTCISRLTFCCYLIHWEIFRILIISVSYSYELSTFQMVPTSSIPFFVKPCQLD